MRTSRSLLLLLLLIGFGVPLTLSADAPPPIQSAADVTTSPSLPEAPPASPAVTTSVETPHSAEANAAPTVIEISDTVQLADAKRFGINIGARSQYGAAQYLKNLVPNPGFEPSEIGMVFLTEAGGSDGRIQADFWDTEWNNEGLRLGHPVGYWNNAQFDIVSGPSKWRSGTVTNFTHEDNRYTYYLNGSGPAITQENVVFVRKQLDGYEWDVNQYNRGERGDTRPGSDGVQSLRLLPASGFQSSWALGMDTYQRDLDPGAGKLYVADGSWHFEIWAKGSESGDQLRILFRRVGENTFFDETVTLTASWQRIERKFSVPTGQDQVYPWSPSMPRNALSLELFVNGGNDIWVDDILLQRDGQTNPTVFTDPFIDFMQELQPGIIRNWGGQLGSTLDTQLAPTFGRRAVGFSPKHRVANNFHYSLHEFLELCQLIGAEPWYVIPPTFSTSDLYNLSAYLSAPAGSNNYATIRGNLGQTTPWTDVFDTIHLEFGNEIWGLNGGTDPFLGASMRGGTRAGEVASDRIGVYKGSNFFVEPKINFVLGGQAFYPPRQTELETASINHNTIGIAPYFGRLDNYANDSEKFAPLYAHGTDVVDNSNITQSIDNVNAGGRGTDVAIYEINLHAITGNIPLTDRNAVLSSQGAAISLPLTMMSYQRDLGIRNQLVYRALQFSTQTTSAEYARIWGLMRDLEATGRVRPTGYAMQLANDAVRGDMITTAQSGSNPTWTQSAINGINQARTVPYVQSFAYRDATTYALVLYNVSLSAAQTVQIELPSQASSVATQRTLSADWIYANNEDSLNVTPTTTTINNFQSGHQLTLPPHSMVVLEWNSNGQPVNSAPIGRDDQFGSVLGQPVYGNVLANDTDPDGDTLTVQIASHPSNGSLALNADGSFIYAIDNNVGLTDSFTYTISDGELTAGPMTVNIVMVSSAPNSIYLPIVTRR